MTRKQSQAVSMDSQRGKSCLINLIAHSEMVGLLDEGSVGTVYLDFRKAFDTVSHRILLDWQLLYGLGGQTVSWVKAARTGRPKC